METLTKSCSPTIVITANGEVQTHEVATVYVKELDIILTTKVLENTPAVLSLGKLFDAHGYSYEWIIGHISLKTVFGYKYNTENFVPIVVSGLSTSSSSSFPSSTSMTPSRQEIGHPPSSSSSSTSPTITSSTVSTKVWLDKDGEIRVGLIPIPQLCQVNMLRGKNGETRALLKSLKSSC